MRLSAALVLFGLLATGPMGAQPALVADLGITQELDLQRLFPRAVPAVLAGGRTFFAHDDGIHGLELWSTDGTPSATAMVADVCPGACSGIPVLWPQFMAAVGARLFFEADDGVTGTELWQSDGTAAGTRRVADLAPNPGVGSFPAWLTPLGDRLIFVAEAVGSTCPLYSFDTTDDELSAIGNFPCASYSDAPSDFTPLNDGLLFSAFTATQGRELWLTDGTGPGTVLVMDVAPGPLSGVQGGLQWPPGSHWISLGSRVIFPADDGVHGAEPWSTDGTPGGTTMLVDLEPGSDASHPGDFSLLAGDLLFVATTAATGTEIWRLPLAGPPLPQALEIAAGPAGSGPVYLGLTSAGAFFAAFRNDVDMELFLTDGTPAGTGLVADLSSASGLIWGASRASTFVEDDRLFFLGSDHRGVEVWRSDGTTAGTTIVADLNPGAADFLPDEFAWPRALPGELPDGRHLVIGMEPLHGREPWVTDGAGNLSLLLDADQQTSIVPCSPRLCTQLVGDGSRLAFPAFDWSAGEPAIAWADGTAQAHLVTPQALGGDWTLRWPAYGFDIAAWANGRFFFAAGVDSSQDQVWVSDGTGTGTQRLRDLVPAVPRDLPAGIIARFGRVFIAFDPYAGTVNERSLWISDGTAAGTELVGPFVTAVQDPRLPVQSFLLFGEEDENTTVWQLDDPGGPPHQLTTLPGEEVWSVVAEIPDRPGGERVLLIEEMPLSFPLADRRLWSWRDTAGLALLAEQYSPPAGFYDFETGFLRPPVALLGDHVLFVAGDAAHGAEPWITDGTPAGTHLVADVYPGPLGSQPRWFAVAGDRLYFSAYEPTAGREVWRSDGDAAELALDLMPGAASSQPTYLTAVEDELYLAAQAPGAGVELVAWDPQQPPAAAIVHDVFAGADSSSPSDLMAMSGQLYFLANDGAHGVELWRLAAGSALFADDFETGAVTRWSHAAP